MSALQVVTITQIVDGTFGDFTENDFARDLQEVIRNFIKFAHQNWGTLYVALGGDVNSVPIRRLVGMGVNVIEIGAGVKRTTDHNPPEKGQCYFLKGFGASKLHPHPDSCKPEMTNPLSSHHGGVLIPYNRGTGPENPGWYFTTEDDFKNLNDGFTRLPDGENF